MAEQNKNTRKRTGMKSFIGGTILTDERTLKQMPFVGFLAVLGLLLIANRNWSESTLREIVVLQEELEELRSESVTLSAKLMDASRPSEVAKRVEQAGIGLQEPMRPPQKITVEKED
ncbi:hypothetical protein FH5T_11880 [Draconibacterium orientale]|jgi:acetyl esterase/lipase|uniref:Cell division protein FtsL n=2 Tax=Draconibacterium orientale TaxID=1168034 RepID=A0ABN4D351_9BACT|nr:hypothetical protein FH5T_11880 [Draconibacterium orientale]